MEGTFLMKVTQRLKWYFKKTYIETEHMDMQEKHMDLHMLNTFFKKHGYTIDNQYGMVPWFN